MIGVGLAQTRLIGLGVDGMHSYRAFVLDEDGHVFRRIDLECQNDEVAKHQAELLVDGHAIELWDGTRKLAKFEPHRCA